jgi:hypothetical protein
MGSLRLRFDAPAERRKAERRKAVQRDEDMLRDYTVQDGHWKPRVQAASHSWPFGVWAWFQWLCGMGPRPHTPAEARLEVQIAMYEEALRFYGDLRNYMVIDGHKNSPVQIDGGARACTVLFHYGADNGALIGTQE